MGKIYINTCRDGSAEITVPRYAANIEGGGGKVLLMPSGHDTLNLDTSIDDKISESFADVFTWDHKKIMKYEALEELQRKSIESAMKVMDDFIGRKGVFHPRIIIVDEHDNHLETTNRTKLPTFERSTKARLLDYELFNADMPLTNPVDAQKQIDAAFSKSKFNK